MCISEWLHKFVPLCGFRSCHCRLRQHGLRFDPSFVPLVQEKNYPGCDINMNSVTTENVYVQFLCTHTRTQIHTHTPHTLPCLSVDDASKDGFLLLFCLFACFSSERMYAGLRTNLNRPDSFQSLALENRH